MALGLGLGLRWARRCRLYCSPSSQRGWRDTEAGLLPACWLLGSAPRPGLALLVLVLILVLVLLLLLVLVLALVLLFSVRQRCWLRPSAPPRPCAWQGQRRRPWSRHRQRPRHLLPLPLSLALALGQALALALGQGLGLVLVCQCTRAGLG